MAELSDRRTNAGAWDKKRTAQRDFDRRWKALEARLHAHWRYAARMREIDRMSDRERLDAGLPPKGPPHWTEQLARIVLAQGFMMR